MRLCMATCKRLCVVVVPCMLAPGLQAEADAETPNWGVSFAEIVLRNDIDIHLLPCTESCFRGLEAGFARKKHGIEYYFSLPGYMEFCEEKACEVAKNIMDIQVRYKIIAIIGVEHSPSCAVHYMYSHHGMRKEPGLFMRKLEENLVQMRIKIPFVGVNRKYPQKSLSELKMIIQEAISEREREGK